MIWSVEADTGQVVRIPPVSLGWVRAVGWLAYDCGILLIGWTRALALFRRFVHAIGETHNVQATATARPAIFVGVRGSPQVRASRVHGLRNVCPHARRKAFKRSNGASVLPSSSHEPSILAVRRKCDSPVDPTIRLAFHAMRTRWQMIKGAPVKGPWSPEEDALLKVLVEEYGSKKW